MESCTILYFSWLGVGGNWAETGRLLFASYLLSHLCYLTMTSLGQIFSLMGCSITSHVCHLGQGSLQINGVQVEMKLKYEQCLLSQYHWVADTAPKTHCSFMCICQNKMKTIYWKGEEMITLFSVGGKNDGLLMCTARNALKWSWWCTLISVNIGEQRSISLKLFYVTLSLKLCKLCSDSYPCPQVWSFSK